MLTARRKEILDFIIEFKEKHNKIPTIREICRHFSLKSTNGIYEHLKALERDGYLVLGEKSARSISLKEERYSNIPLLGEVSAGLPVYPVVEEGECLSLPFKVGKGFLLKVKGDSMIKAGIQEGDMVMVETDKEISNKNIVVALVDGEVTLKRIFFKDDVVELRPENDSYEPIIVNKKRVKIIGRVTTLIRRF